MYWSTMFFHYAQSSVWDVIWSIEAEYCMYDFYQQKHFGIYLAGTKWLDFTLLIKKKSSLFCYRGAAYAVYIAGKKKHSQIIK